MAPNAPLLLERPAAAVQRLFQQAGCPMDPAAASWDVAAHFQQELERLGGADQVPVLTAKTAQHLPDHSLVRFTGMVQDLLNPEYYVGAVQQPDGSWLTTKYSDQVDASAALQAGSPVVWERRPVVIVPVPGLAPWALPAAQATAAEQQTAATAASIDSAGRSSGGATAKAGGKRGLEEVAMDDGRDVGMDADDQDQDQGQQRQQGGKAEEAAEAAAGSGDGMAVDDHGEKQQQQQAPAKRPAPGCGACAGAGHACHQHGGGAAAVAAPAPKEVDGSCLIYLYDQAPSLVLQEVVEVVGIVSHMPELAAVGDALMEGDDADADGQQQQQQHEGMAAAALRAAHPPTSKVMRVHAILVRRGVPLVPGAASPAAGTAVAAQPEAEVAAGGVTELRQQALGLLACALGGDVLAAEYVLLQLLARVTGRVDGGAVGQSPLNICRCPTAITGAAAPAPLQQAQAAGAGTAAQLGGTGSVLAGGGLGASPGALASALQAALSCLVPLSAALPLTVEACNRVSWAPRRDWDTERTAAAPLQLAPGSVVVVDETVMSPGQLAEQGMHSLQALASVARDQLVPYDMEAYRHPVPCDVALVVLTQGRSLLHEVIGLQLPLNVTAPLPTATEMLARAEQLQREAGLALPAVRTYLAAARKLGESYDLGEGMPALLERHFVMARRAAQPQAQPQATAGAAAKAAAAAAGDAALTPDQFQLQLHLARLLALSYGEARLTEERWQQVLALEHARQCRLRVV